MGRPIHLVTGAGGLLGSSIAEQLRQAGKHVRALIRPDCDATFLSQLGAEIVEADLRDADLVRRAVRGASHVYHCAAKVGEWGPWKSFEENTVLVAKNVAAACRQEQIGRLVHVSSLAVYGVAPPGQTIDEKTPTGQRFMLWDYYGRAKWLAEQVIHEFPGATVIRPCWLYGPRDRISTARVMAAIVDRRVPIIGPGDNYVCILHARDAAAAAILAANVSQAVGEVYNLCQEERVRQRDLFDAMTDTLGLPRISRHVPYFLALRFGFAAELIARLLRRPEPPPVNRFVVRLIGDDLGGFSAAKARAQLGWRPQINTREGIRGAVDWFCRLPENQHLLATLSAASPLYTPSAADKQGGLGLSARSKLRG